MKGRFTLDDTFAICCELKKNIQYLRFKNIYDLEDSHSYILKFENNIFITVRVGKCIYESKKHSDKRRLIPSSLCSKIRKHLKNKRLLDIEMLKYDRVIKMVFGFQDSSEKENTEKFNLIIELFSSGNLILTSPDYNILSVLRTHFYDINNIVKSGNQYPLSKIGGENIFEEQIGFFQNYGYHTNYGCISALEIEKMKLMPPICINKSFKSFSEAIEEYYIKLFPSKKIEITTFKKIKRKNLKTYESKKKNIEKFTLSKLTKLMKDEKYYTMSIECIYQNLEDVIKLLTSQQKIQEKTLKINLTDSEENQITISLDIFKNVHQNLEIFYRKRKEICIKIEKTKNGVKKALKQLEEQNSSKKKVDTKILVKNNKKHWYQDYHWFITDRNHVVVSGKNSAQNEELVKKYLDKYDLYFHSTYAGGAITILKNPKQDVITPFELEEAGGFATIHSKAWVEESPDNAYWVNASQVSKTPETGEYVEKGSFIIRGKRNLIRISNLELGIYVKELEGYKRVEIAPYRTALKHSNKCLKIIPGKAKRRIILQKIIKSLNIKSETETPVDIIDKMLKYHICLR